MISVEQAEKLVQKQKADLPPLVTKEVLKSDREYPPYNRSTMDGICVQWSAVAEGVRKFKLLGVIGAGKPASQLEDPEAAFEIMTGAVVPDGSDLVIPYEELTIADGFAEITSAATFKKFSNIHLVGSDCPADAVILQEGAILNGPRWGIAASFGYSQISTELTKKIKIISTGDEVVSIESQPAPHQIRGSNAIAIKASLAAVGFTQVDHQHVADDFEVLKNQYTLDSKNYDWLIYTGGVSKGAFDFLPAVWNECGVSCHFHGVAQRPGKPLWFGSDSATNTLVTGLPGNPISALVCLHRYFLPNKTLFAKLSKPFAFSPKLTFFLPVKVTSASDGTLWAEPLPQRNSGEFVALAQSDGFMELSAELQNFDEGQAFPIYLWRPFL
ncbi:MAG: molybdopterin molybdotransferase MoeA [Bdellovibrio sp.]